MRFLLTLSLLATFSVGCAHFSPCCKKDKSCELKEGKKCCKKEGKKCCDGKKAEANKEEAKKQ